jgi:hypothetical protein
MKPEFTGRCLCGAVHFNVTAAPVVVAQCHCDECRRLSGTGHSIGAMFPRAAVQIEGDFAEYSYQGALGATVTKGFCPRCGSPIFGRNTRAPDHITLPLGAFDDAVDLSVQVVIFERDRPHWDQLGSDVARFHTQPDWTPE